MSNSNPKSTPRHKFSAFAHQRKSGKRDRREAVSAAEMSAHCDAFFRKRGITTVTQFPWSKFTRPNGEDVFVLGDPKKAKRKAK